MVEETVSPYAVTAAEQQSLACLEDGGLSVMLEDGEETGHAPTGYPHNPLLLQDRVV